MAVHIGKLIAQKAKAKRIGATELGQRLSTSKQNIYAIYKRQTIDTGMLLKFSEILAYNFFSHYEKEKTLAGIYSSEILTLKQDNKQLTQQLKAAEEKITILSSLADNQKKLIAFLEGKQKK
jgi:hypothetical protein